MGPNVSLHERQAQDAPGEGVSELSIAELEHGLLEGRKDLRKWLRGKRVQRACRSTDDSEVRAAVARAEGNPSERVYYVGGPLGGREGWSVGRLASHKIKVPILSGWALDTCTFGFVEYVRVAEVNGRMVYATMPQSNGEAIT